MKEKRVLMVVCLAMLLATLGVGLVSARGVAGRALDAGPAAAHTAAISSGAVINGNPLGASFVIRAEPQGEMWPAIAYNSQWREYLVVFRSEWATTSGDIRVERVGWDGRLLGGNWVAAGSGTDRWHPDVAYNSQRNEYMVVWRELDTTSNYNYVRVQRLSADAQPLGGAVTLATGLHASETFSYPAVDYASTADKYLVVWGRDIYQPPTLYDHRIVGQILSSDGQIVGSDISISPGCTSCHADLPDLAYNRHGNGYLVVWKELNSSCWEVYGQLVHGDGGLTGGPILIVGDSYPNWGVAVAAIPTGPSAYKYLVVWEQEFAPGDRDIHGRLVAEDGTLATTSVAIVVTTADEALSDVAGSESNHQFMVAWTEPGSVANEYLIAVRTMSSDSASMGPTAYLFREQQAGSPAVSAGPTGDFLVAWHAVPSTDCNIYGRLWGNRAYLPIVVR